MQGYVSIDIETTGIGDNAQILQISAVYDDLKSPISELKTIDLPIKHEVLTHCEPYAMGMNAELLKKMMDKNFKTYRPYDAMVELISFLESCQELNEKGNRRKVVLAGKNVASFDIPKLRSFLSTRGSLVDTFNNLIHYKTLDVGSLYFDVFKENVSLTEINKLTNRAEVSHNALDDAFDVVHAVRHKLGVKYE
jgi:hypothetical protein